MKKVLSFCLYGDQPMYCEGAVKNSKLAKEIYKDYECIIHVPKGMYKQEFLNRLKDNNATVEECEPLPGHMPTMWRFLPCVDRGTDLVVMRDCDARLTQREYNAVEDFINTDFYVQSIKDHDAHFNNDLLAGMIAVKTKNLYPDFYSHWLHFVNKAYINNYPEYAVYGGNYKGCDQIFLSKTVFVFMKNKIVTYADKNGDKPIGELHDKAMFIGNKFDENDKPEFIRGF